VQPDKACAPRYQDVFAYSACSLHIHTYTCYMLDLTPHNLGSTGSLSSASTPNTHSCTR
jgi:hypothetical protein